MKERDRAEFYQQHKDDADVWEDSEPPETERVAGGRLETVVTVRLSDDDARALRQAAKSMGLSYSDVIRRSLEAFLRPSFEVSIDKGDVLLPWLRPAHAEQAVEFTIGTEYRDQPHTGSLAVTKRTA